MMMLEINASILIESHSRVAMEPMQEYLPNYVWKSPSCYSPAAREVQS